jgi:cleavage and polyadenylation specificity factor subunit 3
VTNQPCSHQHVHADTDAEEAGMEKIRRLAMFLEAHFGDVGLYMSELEGEGGPDEQGPTFAINLDDAEALIHLDTMVRGFNRFAVVIVH